MSGQTMAQQSLVQGRRARDAFENCWNNLITARADLDTASDHALHSVTEENRLLRNQNGMYQQHMDITASQVQQLEGANAAFATSHQELLVERDELADLAVTRLAEITDLELRHGDRAKLYSKLWEKKQELESTNESLKKQVDATVTRINAIIFEQDLLAKDKKDALSGKGYFIARSKELAQELREANERAASGCALNNLLSTHRTELQEQIANLDGESGKKATEFEDQKQHLQQKLSVLQHSVDELNGQNTELQERASTLNREADDKAVELTIEKQQFQQKLSVLRDKLTKLTEVERGSQLERDATKEEVITLQDHNAFFVAQFEALRLHCARLQQSIRIPLPKPAPSAVVKALEHSLATVRQREEVLKDDLSQTKRNLHTLSVTTISERAALEEELEEKNKSVERLRQNLRTADHEVDTLERKVHNRDVYIDRQKERETAQRQEILDASLWQGKASKLEEQLVHLGNELSSATHNANVNSESYTQAEASRIELKGRLAIADQELKDADRARQDVEATHQLALEEAGRLSAELKDRLTGTTLELEKASRARQDVEAAHQLALEKAGQLDDEIKDKLAGTLQELAEASRARQDTENSHQLALKEAQTLSAELASVNERLATAVRTEKATHASNNVAFMQRISTLEAQLQGCRHLLAVEDPVAEVTPAGTPYVTQSITSAMSPAPPAIEEDDFLIDDVVMSPVSMAQENRWESLNDPVGVVQRVASPALELPVVNYELTTRSPLEPSSSSSQEISIPNGTGDCHTTQGSSPATNLQSTYDRSSCLPQPGFAILAQSSQRHNSSITSLQSPAVAHGPTTLSADPPSSTETSDSSDQNPADQTSADQVSANQTSADHALIDHESPGTSPEPPLIKRPCPTCFQRRRPRHRDQRYSIDQKTWDRMTIKYMEKLTHVGRIEETPKGELATTPCECCVEAGFECKVYTEEARLKKLTYDWSPTGYACSRCLMDLSGHDSPCSFYEFIERHWNGLPDAPTQAEMRILTNQSAGLGSGPSWLDLEEMLMQMRAPNGQGPLAPSPSLPKPGSLSRSGPTPANAATTTPASKLACLRRPQKSGEFYSIDEQAWAETSLARQRILTHVGRIEETSDGRLSASQACSYCMRKKFTCKTYTEEARLKWYKGDLGHSCSRCKRNGQCCSLRVPAAATTVAIDSVEPSSPEPRATSTDSQSSKRKQLAQDDPVSPMTPAKRVRHTRNREKPTWARLSVISAVPR